VNNGGKRSESGSPNRRKNWSKKNVKGIVYEGVRRT